MDKETLSNYGWIVILVLILAVLLALATPLGNFVAEGFKAAYAGFGMVSDNALGIVIPGAETDEQHGDNIWFYQPYKGTLNGNPIELVFHEDGGYDVYLYAEDAEGYVYPTGTCAYEEGKVIMDVDTGEAIVTDLGYTVYIESIDLTLKLEKVTQHYLYYDAIYVPVTKSDNFEWHVALHADGSITDIEYYNGVPDDYSCETGSITYESERFKFADSDELYAIYPNGTKIIYLGAVLELDCAHENTEIRNQTDDYTGDTYCKDCDKLLESGEGLGEAYAIYTAFNKTLWFIRAKTAPKVGDMYNGAEITHVYADIETIVCETEDSDVDEPSAPWASNLRPEDPIAEDIQKVVAADKIKPISTTGWFCHTYNCGYYDLAKLDTSLVTDMSYMFAGAGSWNTSSFTVIGLGNWDVSNVKNMTRMFRGAGSSAKTISVNGFNKWNTKSAETMYGMFESAFHDAENITLNLSGWDFSNITGYGLAEMFYYCGYKSTGDVNITLTIKGTAPKITSLNGWFFNVGAYSANSVNIYVSGLDLSEIETIYSGFFGSCGENAKSVSIAGLETWNVSNVKVMYGSFQSLGKNAQSLTISGIESWRPLKLETVDGMFAQTGLNATNFSLDLRNWGIYPSSITNFKKGVESKIIAPWDVPT